MFTTNSKLAELDVSSNGLGSFVDFAKKNCFYWAKPGGSGRDGVAMGLCKDAGGFHPDSISIFLHGAKCSNL